MNITLKHSDGKYVYYNQENNYVYSVVYDYGELYENQYMTFYPDEMTISGYKMDLRKSYELAEKYYNFEIVSIEDDSITTRGPKYEGDLLDYFKDRLQISHENMNWIIDKIIELLIYMKENNLCHHDFAFRNICYLNGEHGKINLFLIDFDQLCEAKDEFISRKQIELFLTYIKFDIQDILGNNIYDLFINKVYRAFNL